MLGIAYHYLHNNWVLKISSFLSYKNYLICIIMRNIVVFIHSTILISIYYFSECIVLKILIQILLSKKIIIFKGYSII